jgi:hypothetical protein
MAIKKISEEEELILVHRGVEMEMREIESGKVEIHSFEEIKKFVEPGL